MLYSEFITASAAAAVAAALVYRARRSKAAFALPLAIAESALKKTPDTYAVLAADTVPPSPTMMVWLHQAPPYYNKDGHAAFRALQLQSTDVILASYGKCGTTFMNAVLFNLLRLDPDGTLSSANEAAPGGTIQVYPDGCPARRGDPAPGRKWGPLTVQDLAEQPSPRLFATHLPAGQLPDLATRGRLVLVLRNPKDAIVSMHKFIEQLALGDPAKVPAAVPSQRILAEGGLPAMKAAYEAEPPPTASGLGSDYFSYYRDMCALAERLGSRTHVVCYEALRHDFAAELARLAAFLGEPLTDAKAAAIAQRTSISRMSESSALSMLVRKGLVGGFEDELTAADWEFTDRIFEARLGGVPLMQQLRPYMLAG